MHLAAVDPVGLAGEPHNLAELVERSFSLRTIGRKRVTEIQRVIAVAVEIRPGRKPRRGDRVDHGPVAQHRQIEAIAVKRHKLRAQLGDLLDERRNQLLFGSLPDMRRAERVHHPGPLLTMRDESADADDRMIDMLWKLIADRFQHLRSCQRDRSPPRSRADQVRFQYPRR